jgi:hypothetical protein
MKKILIGLVTSLFLSSAALAGQFGVGVTGSIAAISGQGTESDQDGATDLGAEGASLRTASAAETAIIPSVFAEYSFDNGFVLGYDYVIGAANVNQSALTRTDVTVDANEAAQDDGARTAQAEIENVMSVYAEVPIHAGLYGKLGYVQMDVNTLETTAIAAGGTYANTSVDGTIYGAGYKNSFGSNGFYKIEGTHTTFDSIAINSSTDNKITADLDVTKATFAIGYNF